jgi:acyl carrier protein
MSDPRSQIREALRAVAPEADFDALEPDRPIRDQVELDSMDYLGFLIRLKRLSGVELPAGDAGRNLTLNGLITEIRSRSNGMPASMRTEPRSG